MALGCQFLSGQAPSTEVLLEANAGVKSTWRQSFLLGMGGRRAVHLVLGRDSLWCLRGVVADRTPLRLIDDVRRSLGGRRLFIRTAQPGGFVTRSFNFRSRKECRIWQEGLRSGRDRERAAPGGDPDLEKVTTGPVVLVKRQPTQRYQLLGQVEAHDRRKKSARAGMITRARMMGADAVVDLEEERVPGPRRTLWRSTGSAIRAVDSEGRWQLKARWFGRQVGRWTTFCLAFILGEFLFICIFYSWGIGKEMVDRLVGTHLPVTTLIAWMGLMRLIPFVLCVALHRLPWGQLVRPAAAAVIILGTAPVVINVLELAGSIRSGQREVGLTALLYALQSLPDFAICLFFGQKLSGLRSDYRSLLLDEDRRPPYVRRVLGGIAHASLVVYLVFILAIAVPSFLVGPRPSWSQLDKVLEAESLLQRGVANATVNPGDAESAFKEALTRYGQIAKELPGEPSFRINMGAASLNLALIAQRSNRFGEAEEWFRQSASIYEALAAEPRSAQEANKRLAVTRAARAVLLLTCPDPRIQNAAEAIRSAQSSTELDRSNPECWITLGVLEHNAGHPHAAIGAIQKAMWLRNGGDAREWFLMAEAHAKAGDQGEAKRWFDKAASWMEANRPDDSYLRALRAEAARVLGRANSRPWEATQ